MQGIKSLWILKEDRLFFIDTNLEDMVEPHFDFPAVSSGAIRDTRYFFGPSKPCFFEGLSRKIES